VAAPFAEQAAPVPPQVPDQLPPLHDTAPAGTSWTSVLAVRCR
jgi:hypothetical protein